MNLLDLALRFQALNLNGSDLTVEVRRESPNHRRVTSVSITGRLVHPIDEMTDYEFQFVIDIDRNRQTIDSNVQGTIIDHEEGDTFPGMISFENGFEAFQEAEAIANTLEALLTPEPPAEPTVTKPMPNWTLTYSGTFTGPYNNRRWEPGWWVAVNRVTGQQVAATSLAQFELDYFRSGYGLPKYVGKLARNKNLKWFDRLYTRQTKIQSRLDRDGKTMTGRQWLAA